jgi:signal transduction histidine kinase
MISDALSRPSVLPSTISPFDLRNVFDSIVNGAVTLLGYDLALLTVVDKPKNELGVCAAAVAPGQDELSESLARVSWREVRMPLDQTQSLLLQAAQSGKNLVAHSFSDLWAGGPDGELASGLGQSLAGLNLVVVPLLAGGQLVGGLIAGTERDELSDIETSLLGAFANQCAMAIENARLYDQMNQRLAEVSTLYLLANQVSSSLDLNVVLDSVMDILKEVLNCRGGCIFLLDEKREWLEIRASSGIKPYWQREARMRLGEGISGQVAETAQPVYIPDTRLHPDFLVFDPAVRSLLVVPLIFKGEVIGTLNVDDDEPNAFSEDVSRLLSIAAAQAAAAIQTARLYTDLRERAETLAQAHLELQESDRLRAEFVQNMSHELRTPLTFVRGYVELLLEGRLGPLTEQQKQGLGIVAQRTKTIIELVNDILALQQVERGELHFAPLSMEEIARSAIEGAGAAARQGGLSLVADFQPGLPSVLGDRARLDQVFNNLIGNALKFSPETGGTITVRLRKADGFVRVDVIDQGIGIAGDHLTRIFERFYQVDGSSKRRFGGTGLGLAIVKEIVDAHGGTVMVESEPNVGSTFSFTVPFAPGQTE